jgi:hypothetical protein
MSPPLLTAVFWDYPGYTDEGELRRALLENPSDAFRRWVLLRFIKYGRTVDTLRFFNIREIENALRDIPATSYEAKKWNRIAEVYHALEGK